MPIHKCTHTHTYKYTYLHTYIHTYIHMTVDPGEAPPLIILTSGNEQERSGGLGGLELEIWFWTSRCAWVVCVYEYLSANMCMFPQNFDQRQ